ncbi:hypothetical protein GSI_03699 [Ganoderma sinense ZZ0214-1]|uniref:Uncharacterized protein n=1 Tax=Ganoderma sinense ZZ0214-1 TaxID=1077348 RepID=A0A2G8SJP5_9APHY|nr:hypothetical protein GSI_03699 [Ganoderma sinense ZZ0214-1]
MLIRDLHSANDEVNDLTALVLPTFDARVGNLVASFEHLVRAEQPNEEALFAKLRNLVYEIDLRAVLSTRSAPVVVEWIRRVEEACGALENSRAFVEEFEDAYHRMRDERVGTALACCLARLDDLRFVANALRGVVYRTGFSSPSVVARVDHALDWIAGENLVATIERNRLATFTNCRLMNTMLTEQNEDGEGEGEFEGVEIVAG